MFSGKRFLCFTFCCVLVLTILSCTEKVPVTPKPTFSFVYSSLIAKKCMLHTCHSSYYYKDTGNLDFTSGKAYANLVNVKSKAYPDLYRVKPGDADNSLLVMRLEGTVVVSVPLERSSITKEDISIIREWINKGAKND